MTNKPPHTCPYCHGDRAYHRQEAQRIVSLFDSDELAVFAEYGPVKSTLRVRLVQELQRGMEQSHARPHPVNS